MNLKKPAALLALWLLLAPPAQATFISGTEDAPINRRVDRNTAKTLDFHGTISVTGGMPILRTSVDHGTAMDIAGSNIASESSMVKALILAGKYSPAFIRRK